MKYFIALISLFVFISCSSDDEVQATFELWEGPMITFEKEAGADPTMEANQDRINADVWITRGNCF